MSLPPDAVPSLPDLVERLARLEERVAALETAAGEEGVRSDELAKVAWAVAHGRKRPW
jgi:hypothetical protein